MPGLYPKPQQDMTKHIGRLINVGLNIEGTRGTAVAPASYVPRTDLTFDEKTETVQNESAVGVIADVSGSAIAKQYAEGEISGVVTDKSVGYLLTSALGALPTTAETVVGEVYTHEFALANTNAHKSLSIAVDDPNLGKRVFPLAMLDELTLTADEGEFATFSASFKSKPSATNAFSTTYLPEAQFLARKATLSFADNLAGLATGTAVCAKSIEVKLAKNLEEQYCLGSLSPTDILNKQFSVEGSFTMVFDSGSTFRDFHLNGTQKALRIDIESATEISTGVFAKLRVDVALASFTEFSRSMGNDEIVSATVTFKGMYSLADSEIVNIILTNSEASYA